MNRWITAIYCLGLLFSISGCGASPDSGLSEIARGEMPSATTRAPNGPPDDTARYDLARDEARGGHTLDKHVGRSDSELRERLDRQRNISAASTWTNCEVAEEAVGQACAPSTRKLPAGNGAVTDGRTWRYTLTLAG